MPYELWQNRTYEIIAYAIVDGDTVDVTVAEERPPRQRHRLRLHGIDAPELAQPYGPEAAQYLDNMMARPSRLFASITQESDYYGRPIAILHHGNPNNSLNARLVRAGLAYAAYGDDYRNVDPPARSARAGVWQQRGGGERPWDYRRGQRRGQRPGRGCFGIIAVAVLLACLLLLITAALG